MTSTASLTQRYDRAADRWGDKMRTLGYADAYLGFLTSVTPRPDPSCRVLDVGCGSGSFAAAWIGVFGAATDLHLLEPSAPMLSRAMHAATSRGASPHAHQSGIDGFTTQKAFDQLLVAHVLEHVADPVAALARMRTWVQPGATLWLAASKPHWCNAIIWLQWRHRAFKQEEVALMLDAAGWQLDMTYPFPSGPPSRTSCGYVAIAR
jgi:2-polyprenyl-3-methyl-5-hydroxy-6-metoxy-1,4-benzoquinol methylase